MGSDKKSTVCVPVRTTGEGHHDGTERGNSYRHLQPATLVPKGVVYPAYRAQGGKMLRYRPLLMQSSKHRRTASSDVGPYLPLPLPWFSIPLR